MPTRTITAQGTITNTGNVQASFRAVLWSTDGASAIPIIEQLSEEQVLAPGATSPPITLSHVRTVSPGSVVNAQVELRITSPQVINDVAVTSVVQWVEPILAGTLAFPQLSITRALGRRAEGAFAIGIGETQETPWLAWAFLVAGVAVVLGVLSPSGRRPRRRR